MTAYFISSTGNDSNDGLTLGTAWLSWNAIHGIPEGAHTVLITGDIGGTALGRILNNRQLTISGATSTIGALQKITPAANAFGTYLNNNLSSLVFADPFEWDCTNVTSSGIAINAQSANGSTLTLPDGFKFTNCIGVNRCIWLRAATGTCTHTVSIGAVTCESNQMPKRFIEVEQLNDSSLIVDGMDVGDQTGLSLSENTIVYMSGVVAAGSTTEFKNIKGSVGTTGTQARGVYVEDADRVLIEGCNLTLQAGTSVLGCVIDGTSGGADGIIRNNIVNLLTPSGYGCRIGNETVGGTVTDNGRIYNNDVIGTESGTSTIHGVMISNCDNGYLGFNRVRYTLIGAIIKASTGSVMTRNEFDYILEGTLGNACLVKSSVDALVTGNNITIRDGYECTAVEVLWDSPTTSTGTEVIGNHLDIKANADMATASAQLVTVGSGSDASTATRILGNNYYLNGEAMPTNMFSYGGTDYATLALWNAAATVSHELSQELTAAPVGGSGRTGTITSTII